MGRLWLVGKYIKGEFPDIVWEFQGIFDSKALAFGAMRNESYFMASIELNQQLPDKTRLFPDVIYFETSNGS